MDNFVTWYNITYIGSKAAARNSSPDCWRQHPSLAMELATLVYSWRAANIGPLAKPRDAQYWHHQWRPGFTDRLNREWAHTECLDGEHRAAGAAQRPDLFTLAEKKLPAEEDNTWSYPSLTVPQVISATVSWNEYCGSPFGTV